MSVQNKSGNLLKGTTYINIFCVVVPLEFYTQLYDIK